MQEFNKMLSENKAKRMASGPDQGLKDGNFELRKVERDSEGKERYIKTDEDDAIFKGKIQEMGAIAAQQLKDVSYEERVAWMEAKKKEGNDQYKSKNFEAATEKYLFGLCGYDFKKKCTNEQRQWAENNLKIPLLNNMGQCLIQQKRYVRAVDMLEQALKVDGKNEKALLRQCQAFIELGDHERATKVLKRLQDIAIGQDKSSTVHYEINKLQAKMKKSSTAEKEFAKNLFSGKESLYDEKPNAITKEEEAKLLEEQKKQDEIDKNLQEIQDETDHLAKLSNIQWVIYPFFKCIEKVCEATLGCCKAPRMRRNREAPVKPEDKKC